MLGSQAGAQRQRRSTSRPTVTAGGGEPPRDRADAAVPAAAAGNEHAAVPAAAAGREHAAAVSCSPGAPAAVLRNSQSPSSVRSTDLSPGMTGGGMSPLRNTLACSPHVRAERREAAGVAGSSGASPPNQQPQVGATTLLAAELSAPVVPVWPPMSEPGSRFSAGSAANSPSRGSPLPEGRR